MAIECSRDIENKKIYQFIKLNIAELYPSILVELLTKSINFARSIIEREYKIINIIKHERKPLLLMTVTYRLKKKESLYLS